MELGDRKLVVQPAQSGQRGTGQSTGGMTGANAGALGVRSFALPTAGEGGGEPTACMTMLNMVTPEELVDDVEYGEIVEDVRDECAKYGEVLDVRIPRPVAQSKGEQREERGERTLSASTDPSVPLLARQVHRPRHGKLRSRAHPHRQRRQARSARVSDACTCALLRRHSASRH